MNKTISGTNARPAALLASMLLAASAFVGCDSTSSTSGTNGSTSSDPGIGDSAYRTLAPTHVGDSAGATRFFYIGATGGTLYSDDGSFKVVVPPGALEQDTVLGIQKVDSTVPGALGGGWKLRTNGVGFAKPLQLIARYTDVQLIGTDPSALIIYHQNADSTWTALDPILDSTEETVSSSLDLSNLPVAAGRSLGGRKQKDDLTALVPILYLRPATMTISQGESAQFGIYGIPLGNSAPILSVNNVSSGNSTIGTVDFAGQNTNTIIYQAPKKLSESMTVKLLAVVNRKGKLPVKLVGNVTVIPKADYKGTVTGGLVRTIGTETVRTQFYTQNLNLHSGSPKTGGHLYSIDGEINATYSYSRKNSSKSNISCKDINLTLHVTGSADIYDIPPDPSNPNGSNSSYSTYDFSFAPSEPYLQFSCTQTDTTISWPNDGEGGTNDSILTPTTKHFVVNNDPITTVSNHLCDNPVFKFSDPKQISDSYTASCSPSGGSTRAASISWSFTQEAN